MACCTSGGSGHVVQLIQLRIGTVVTGKSGCLPQIINRWVERRIGMVRGTLVSNYVVMFVGDAVAEYLDNSRFAEATASEPRAELCALDHRKNLPRANRYHSRSHDDGQIPARAVSRLPYHNRGAMTTLHAEVERNAAHQL